MPNIPGFSAVVTPEKSTDFSVALRRQWTEEVYAAIRARRPGHLLVMVGERFDLAEDKPTPDHTTLQRFEAWVMTHHPRLFFTVLLKQSDGDFPDERHAIQFGDTFALWTRAGDPTRTELLRTTALRLWRAFTAVADPAGALLGHFQAVMGVADEPKAFLLSPQERQARTLETAKVAYELPAAVDEAAGRLPAPHELTVAVMRQWMARLQKILVDEFVAEWDEQGRVADIRFCTEKERGSYRIISAVDPEATLRVHNKSVVRGYNVSVAATERFVREIAAATGATPDSVGIAPLVQAQLDALGFAPPKLVYDQAGGTPKLIAAVEKASQGQTQLVVRMVDYNPQRTRFSTPDFSLGDAGLTCPNGQIATRFYPSGSADGWNYRFLAEQCRTPASKPTSHRQVFLSDYQVQSRRAIASAKTAAFEAEMKQRSHIERIISRSVACRRNIGPTSVQRGRNSPVLTRFAHFGLIWSSRERSPTKKTARRPFPSPLL